MCVCIYVHACARGRHERKNIFEAKYIIQKNKIQKIEKKRKNTSSLDPTFDDGKEHTYPSKKAPLLSS